MAIGYPGMFLSLLRCVNDCHAAEIVKDVLLDILIVMEQLLHFDLPVEFHVEAAGMFVLTGDPCVYFFTEYVSHCLGKFH